MRWAAKRSNGTPRRLVVAAGRLDQPEGAGPGQLLPVHVAREVHRHLEHDVLHQRQVLLDELGQLLRSSPWVSLSCASASRPPIVASVRTSVARPGRTLGQHRAVRSGRISPLTFEPGLTTAVRVPRRRAHRRRRASGRADSATVSGVPSNTAARTPRRASSARNGTGLDQLGQAGGAEPRAARPGRPDARRRPRPHRRRPPGGPWRRRRPTSRLVPRRPRTSTRTRARTALGVGRPQHRQPGGEPVAPGRRPPGRSPGRRRGRPAPAAGRRAARPGSSRAAPTGSGNQHSSRPEPPAALHPAAVAPVERRAAEGPVVLAGAGRAAGAEPGHVDLVDRVEAGGGVAGEHAGQARARSRRRPRPARPARRASASRSSRARTSAIVVGDRHHRDAARPGTPRPARRGCPAGRRARRRRRRRTASDGARLGDRDRRAERRDDRLEPVRPLVAQQRPRRRPSVDTSWRAGAGADRAARR